MNTERRLVANATNELKALALSRAQERFPEAEIRTGCAWYDTQFKSYRCTLSVNGLVAFGYGKSMNACCDDLLKSVATQLEIDWNTIIHAL